MDAKAKHDDVDVTLVAVVIPAYNAAVTLAETLESVLAQTHTALDIVVVDDGSTDNTRQIAEAFAERDPRVRVLSQPNGGVARARNTGIAATTAEFVAPLDADDLWHPEKIARQLAVMRAGGRDMGFVYTLFRTIDGQSRVDRNSGVGPFHGWVYLRHLVLNFVGNGSTLLLCRAALEEVGGYDPALYDQGVQGTEDYLIQLLIARRWQVGLAPEYLVGYRKSPGAMSADGVRMAYSRLACLDIVARHYPETPLRLLNQARARAHAEIFLRSLPRYRFSDSLLAVRNLAGTAPLTGLAHALRTFWDWLANHMRAVTRTEVSRAYILQPFLSLQSDEGKHAFKGLILHHQLRSVAMLEGPLINKPGLQNTETTIFRS